MGIFQTINDCHKHWNIYEEWDAQNKTKYARKKYLFDNYKQSNPLEFKKLKSKSDIVIRSVNILDNASENAAENMQVATEEAAGLLMAIPMLAIGALNVFIIGKSLSALQKTKKLPKYFYTLPFNLIALAIVDLPLSFWKAQKQIEASRVARAKAREEELKDIRNFVAYTPEQFKEAQKIANTMKSSEIENEDKKNISLTSAFKALINSDEEYSKYLKKYNQHLGIDKEIKTKLSEKYSEKELQEAKQDKEILLHGVKEINNNAEKYCENVEAGFATLRIFSFALTIPAIYIFNKLLNLCVPKAPGIVKKAVAAFVPLAAMFPVIIYMNNKQKEAAKVGRYKIKQEFFNDISKLAYFEDKDLEKAKHISYKAEKNGLFKRAHKSFKFIPKYLKDRDEFLAYKKAEWEKEEKLYKALKTLPITKEQEENAKKLQKKVFFVFDELDEMSQKYSEHMEGTIDVSKKIIGYIRYAAVATLYTIPLYLALESTFPTTKFIKKMSDMILKKESEIRKNINEIYDIAMKDKNVKTIIDRSLALEDNTAKKILKEPKIAKQLQNLINIFSQLFSKNNASKGIIKEQLKDGFFAKWALNLSTDIAKLIFKRLAKESADKLPNKTLKDIFEYLKEQKFGTGKFKTLKRTSLVLALPVLAGAVYFSYLFNSFFAHLQKKAGYIGVMKSINKLDNPNYFATKEENSNTTSNAPNQFGNFNIKNFQGFNI